MEASSCVESVSFLVAYSTPFRVFPVCKRLVCLEHLLAAEYGAETE